jgi:hypothetical protein
MPEEVNENAQFCKWCSKSIPIDAVVCPYCRKWRKDIDRDRIIAYICAVLCAIIGIIAVPIIRNDRIGNWWVFILAFIMAFAITLYFTVKVSRKIRTWWWF